MKIVLNGKFSGVIFSLISNIVKGDLVEYRKDLSKSTNGFSSDKQMLGIFSLYHIMSPLLLQL